MRTARIAAIALAAAVVTGCGVSAPHPRASHTASPYTARQRSFVSDPRSQFSVGSITDPWPGSAPKPAWHKRAHYTGTGNWNGPPFRLVGSSPEVRVAYSCTGNATFGSPDNFIADLVSPHDDQLIASTIADSGSRTTRLHPDLSNGESPRYHLEAQASGSWSFTISERY
jgi:hypothetical protein